MYPYIYTLKYKKVIILYLKTDILKDVRTLNPFHVCMYIKKQQMHCSKSKKIHYKLPWTTLYKEFLTIGDKIFSSYYSNSIHFIHRIVCITMIKFNYMSLFITFSFLMLYNMRHLCNFVKNDTKMTRSKNERKSLSLLLYWYK